MVTRQEILDGIAKLLGEEPAPTTAPAAAGAAPAAATAPARPAASPAPTAPAVVHAVGDLVTAPNGQPAIVVAKDMSVEGAPRYQLGYFGSVSEGAIELG